jgi:DNA primase catalytic core
LSSRGTVGLNYVKKRGLNEVSVKKFRLGFAPNSFSSLIDHLKNSNFTEEDMLAAGVVAKNERNMYDKFRNRIMFPVFGDSGKVIAFSGRIIEDDNQSPKYMNSPETPIYHKSDVLFNYFFAKKAIYDSKCAILVEGNIDVLSLSANGIENVVAPLGTAVTPQQVVKLWKITDEIIVCFDGDLAGQNASKRMALMVLPMITPRKNIKIACLPNGQDPDSLMRSLGKNYFMKFVKENSSCLALSEFLWINELRDAGLSFNDPDIIPERKSRLEEKLDEITKEIKNDVVSKNFRNFYKNRLFLLGRSSASRKTFSRSKLVDYRANTNLLSYGKILASPNNTENLKNNVINVEKRMFYILAANLELIDKAIQVHSIDIFGINFFSKDASAIMNIFSRAIESNRINDRDFLLDLLEKNDLRDYVLGSSKFVANSIEDNLKYLYSLVLERSIFVLEIEIKELSLRNNNEARRKSLMDELQLLHDRKSEWDSKF